MKMFVSLRDRLGFNRHFVGARLLVAVANQAFPLCCLLQQERRSAFGAGLGDGLAPYDEVAIGVFGAAVENFSAFRTALDQFAAAPGFGTRNSDGFRFDVLALRIIAAGNEFTEPAFFHGKLGVAALRTSLLQQHVRFLRRFRSGRELSGGLAFGVTRTGEELAKTAALQRHRPAAVFTRLGFGLRRGFSFLRGFIAAISFVFLHSG